MIIANRKVGGLNTPLIIAELGINHGGNINIAKQMVYAAKQAGCEIIKHQTHFIEDEMSPEAKDIYPPNANISIWEVMENSSLSPEEEIELKKYVESLDMIYISTPFSRKAADFLYDIGVPAFKIGSGESNHLPLIKHIAKMGKPIIMSTGMQSIETIKKSVQIIEEHNIDYALLQCTNLYPSAPEYVCLKGIEDLRANFPRAIIGFSDHSIGPYISMAAVALGASIIERHFTDNKYRVGPDIICSMDPVELNLLVNICPQIHVAKLNERKRSIPEDKVYKFARASVVADKNLAAGHTISENDIWARRPGNGEISVDDFYSVIGKKLKKSVLFNEQLTWNHFE